jgi:signal transduction histidine kinase
VRCAVYALIFFNSCTHLTFYFKNPEAVIKGAAVAFLGLAAGVGMVAFTESAGERAKVRGSGLSDGMTTRITGQLMEDVEVSSVADLGSLTEQLEAALKETGGADAMDLKMTEEEKKRIAEELEDGW